MSESSFLELSNLSAAYQAGKQVVCSIDLSLEQGDLGCLLGPSGCGKTTVLRTISGFQSPESGYICLDGEILSNAQHSLAPELRNVGMVFQDHALFPHLNIEKNIAFGLNRLSRADKQKRISELLDLVGLMGLEHKYPHELSGGQSQRVALARALAPKPKLLLLDEPFSSLDRALRESLGSELRAVLKHLKMTAIMVTHDHNEAFTLADTIGVMSQGSLLQWGRASDLYHQPKDVFVAEFIGAGSLLKGRFLDNGKVETSIGIVSIQTKDDCDQPNREDVIHVLLRDDDLRLNKASETSALVERKIFRGSNIELTLKLDSGELITHISHSISDYTQGDRVGITISDRALRYFP